MTLGAFAQGSRFRRALVERRAIPFDYAFRFKFFDEKHETRSFVDQTLSATLTVSIEASFTAVSIGYGLIPRLRRIPFGLAEEEDLEVTSQDTLENPPRLPTGAEAPRRVISLLDMLSIRAPTSVTALTFATVTAPTHRVGLLANLSSEARAALIENVPPRRIQLGEMINALGRALGEREFAARGEIGAKTAFALQYGIRANPKVFRSFLLRGGSTPLPGEELAELFETVEAPAERIQFLYALHDQGTGRAFQSEPLLNVAGLGIDDGDRPFRSFAPPITFDPQTVIRLDVIPKSEFKGELHVVLHGYKVLGEAGTPTGRKLRPRRRARRVARP